MTSHDQLFKDLVVNFFGDLVRLMAPRLAQHTDLPEGSRRQLDLVAWGIGGSVAERYARRPEPLAWALAALMRPRRWRPARHKLECLRRIAQADLDEARRFLLANCVQTYLQLEPSEQERYASLREHADDEEVRAMEMTWAEKMTEKGRVEGRVEGMRSLVLHLAERRWGLLDEATRRRIEAIDSADSLARLHDRLLTAASPEEAGLA